MNQSILTNTQQHTAPVNISQSIVNTVPDVNGLQLIKYYAMLV
jgi:hypothetical protein